MTNNLKEFFKAIPPLSQNRKDGFLDIVRDRVSYYQPRIEDRCDVSLGEIYVRDYRYRYSHLCRMALEEGLAEEKLNDKVEFILTWIGMQTLRPIISPFLGQTTDCFMSYLESTFYMPFNFRTRVSYSSLKEREENLDQAIIHELSHRLWEVLSGDNIAYELAKIDGDLDKSWVEGFAAYCDSHHFTDFYPSGFELVEHNAKVYERGKKKVKRLVEKYGEDIILEVPRRWRELDKEN